jgi:hypothetical protein
VQAVNGSNRAAVKSRTSPPRITARQRIAFMVLPVRVCGYREFRSVDS